MKTSLVLLFLFLFPIISTGKNQVFAYDLPNLEFKGSLDLQTFPGPPNFESIKDGDEVERHFYLKLNNPIDIMPKDFSPRPENSVAERNVRILQLAIDGKDHELWSRFREYGEGHPVKIKGYLFHRSTGHHHSRVLLNVSSLEELKK